MKEFIVSLLIFGGAAVFAGWLLCAIIDAVCDHKELKKRMAHPQFYGWIEELGDVRNQITIFHNKNISPFEKLIDDIVKNWKYYPAELRAVKKDELELFRLRLYQYKEMEKSMKEQEQELLEKIKAYRAKHNLEKCWDE